MPEKSWPGNGISFFFLPQSVIPASGSVRNRWSQISLALPSCGIGAYSVWITLNIIRNDKPCLKIHN